MQNAALDPIISQPLVAEVLLKVEESNQLSPQEQLRLTAFLFQAANRWEMAYWWHQQGVIADDDWEDWERVFRITATNWMSPEIWQDMRPSYSEEFIAHVDQHYASGDPE